MQTVVIKKQTDYNLPETLSNINNIFNIFNLEDLLKNKTNILIKPNLLAAHHPDKAVTTHPVIVEAVIIALKKLNKNIIVGDSPGGTVKASVVYEETGIKNICDKHNIKLVDFGKDGIVTYKSDIVTLYFDKNIIDVDAIINIAKMKTHCLMLYTGAVKNLYGAIPGLYKSELHKLFPNPNEFSKVLSTIYNYIKPKIALNIIDGIVGMEGDGPSAGNPYPFGMIIAAEKATAADYVASKIMGFNFENIIYLKQSLKDDNINENDINIHDFNDFEHKKVKIKRVIFINKILDKMPRLIKNILNLYLSKFPKFKKNCKMCMICKNSCPVKAIGLKDNKLFIDKNICIKCLCCHEMCPVAAIDI